MMASFPCRYSKYNVLRRWLRFSFTALGICQQYVAVLKEKTKSRGHCLAAAHIDADQSWLGNLRLSAVLAFRLLEAWSKHMGFALGVLASLSFCLIVADLYTL